MSILMIKGKNTKLVITGKNRLSGRVRVAGAKNAALPELAASLLSTGEFHFSDVPQVDDIKVMFDALRNLGVQGEFDSNTVKISIPEVTSALVPKEIAETSRASVLILGPLVARNRYAKVSLPGGCSIGDRNINYHLQGLREMGVDIYEEDEYIIARTGQPLQAIDYSFPAPTVTGTENLLMAAALAEGTTILRNCALEPEIGDLIDLLQAMGAPIEGKNSTTLTITGQTTLNGVSHRMIPDRIEMGTYVIAACLGDNDIVVENAVPEYIHSLLKVLEEIGIKTVVTDDSIRVNAHRPLKPVAVETLPYPDYPTDLQAQLTTLLTQVEGGSRIKENIFDNRFQHVEQLKKMGARIDVNGDLAEITGQTPLTGTTIRGTDLRASAALVLAALIADGETVIENACQLFRGYENMPGKLESLGADIKVIDD
ncbi:MAG: UDP-N-acetylglucosamine 1-carboxyvinyltransferase [bacterium]|nr:UDP-N-acetylglucosamine 1-carboxyvinyltransferase [bacterium]